MPQQGAATALRAGAGRPGDGERNRALSSATGARRCGAARPLLTVAAALLCVAATAPAGKVASAEARTEPQNRQQEWQRGQPRRDARDKPGAKEDAKPGNRNWQEKRRQAGGGAGPGASKRKGGGPGAGGQGGGRPPMFVGVDAVRKGPLARTEPVIGRIVATRQGVVAARVSGAVVAIAVAVGEHVRKGQILARQDTSTAEARLAFEIAEMNLAERELTRSESLRKNKSAAFARTRYDAAVHRLARAKANVRLARLAIEGAVVVAPYDGVVIRKATELGAFLKDGSAVVELVNDTEVEIEADVPADRLGGLRPGSVVSFSVRSGGVPHRARVRALLPMQNALTRTQAVRFVPLGEAPAGNFSINQAVTVDVPLGATRVVVSVHKDAIVNRGAVRLVFLVKGGRAVPRPVALGDAIGSRFVVHSGVTPGDIAVVRGNERLRPGQPVRHRPLMGAAARRQIGDRGPAERKPAN